MQFSTLLNDIKSKQVINATDVLALRQIVWPDGKIDQGEAEMLFSVNDTGAQPSAEWVEFFVAAITEFLINQQLPKGYISNENAAWLMHHIDADGRLDSEVELEVLVRTLEKATGAPETLQKYALQQIENVVLTGEGPTRCGGDIKPGCITDAEVNILRRLLYAAASDGPARISRSEADLLFRLKDGTLHAENSSQWKTAFVQMVGNHLMAHNSYEMLDRDEAARREKYMDNHESSVGGFFKRMAKSDIGGTFKTVIGDKGFKKDSSAIDHIEQVEKFRTVDQTEQQWLNERINADQTTDPLEKALLEFLAEESGRSGF